MLGAAALVPAGLGPAAASIAMEKELGEEFSLQARQQLPLSDDYEINRMVTDIGDALVEAVGHQPFDYEFAVVADDSINAFAVPGGKIYVHAGLISRVSSEDALAGVLAHEIAHVHAHHAIRQQQKSAAGNYAALAGVFLSMINPILGQAAMAAGLGQNLKYQRDFEREADFLGLDYVRDAGFDPSAMLGLLRVIYDEQKLNPTNVPPYFLSHPLTGERMANMESKLRSLEWNLPPAVMSRRLERAATIARAMSQTREQAVPVYERRLSRADEISRPAELELIGLLMLHGEEYVMAEKYLSEAEKLGRSVDRELGRALLRRGKYEAARSRLIRAVASDDEDWNALEDLGELDYLQGDFQHAIERLESSFKMFPWRPQAARTLARALDRVGKRERGFFYLATASDLEAKKLQALSYYKQSLPGLEENGEERAKAANRIRALEKDTAPSRGAPRRPPVPGR
ncbi:MAG: M48 family metalloprotease [Candidatus Binatia bacterium]